MLKSMLVNKDFQNGIWLAGRTAVSQSEAVFENIEYNSNPGPWFLALWS